MFGVSFSHLRVVKWLEATDSPFSQLLKEIVDSNVSMGTFKGIVEELSKMVLLKDDGVYSILLKNVPLNCLCNRIEWEVLEGHAARSGVLHRPR